MRGDSSTEVSAMNSKSEKSIIFHDRAHAAQLLAPLLADYANDPNTILLALPRGGIPVAFEIAKALHLPVDVVLVRKLGAPSNPEYAIGALAFDDTCILNAEAVKDLDVTKDEIAEIIQREKQELLRRALTYRGNRPMPILSEQTVILVDDGLATGLTMRAAVTAIKKYLPREIIVAAPVAALSTYQEFSKEVDKIVCVETPENFISVGKWYANFKQVTDAEVCRLLAQANTDWQS